ncbi:MAG: DUF5011 domain-containing protein [Bacteroidales bacterium]|nr:DUF5011 domain-containing protein [Bacteroidales bacterium]HQP03798.1 DUF5011 domain-containing protein [Bacteroidales bacterium]
MKTSIKLSIFIFTVFTVFFTSCGIKDNKPPRIYLIGSNDTTIIHREKFVDPGYFAEDNVTHTENIILSNNRSEILDTNSDGYTTRHEIYEITYTATDEEGNSKSVIRKITVNNISTPYAQSYNVIRRQSSFFGDTTYRATVTVDTRVSGRLKISKMYIHKTPGTNNLIYYRVNADLWASDLVRTQPHYDNANNNSGIGFMGLSDDNNSVPWFRGMGYDEANALRKFEYINIQTNTYTDSIGNAAVFITGKTESDGFTPQSRIEYIGSDISKIVLKYTVTNNAVTPPTVDQVLEEYTPVD